MKILKIKKWWLYVYGYKLIDGDVYMYLDQLSISL